MASYYLMVLVSHSCSLYIHSVQFSRSVVSDSLRPHESQHARPPCPSPTPGAYSNSCPSSRWCLPAISPSVIPFSSCPQILAAWEFFPMSQLFAWGGQSVGVSALASVLSIYIHYFTQNMFFLIQIHSYYFYCLHLLHILHSLASHYAFPLIFYNIFFHDLSKLSAVLWIFPQLSHSTYVTAPLLEYYLIL